MSPFTLSAMNAKIATRPIRVTQTAGLLKSPSWTSVAGLAVTMPPSTRPMKVMNKPMPTPIARFRLIGMAFMMASRSPVSTSRRMTMPSTKIDRHAHLPRHAGAEDDAERDDRVEAHARRERERPVRDEAHRDAHEGRTKRGGGGESGDPVGTGLAERGREDARVHEDDVRHGHERRDSRDELGLDRGAAFTELEELLHSISLSHS